ncbi:MAG: hypothetical protein KBF42_05490 [Chitinophagales bacterium]|jgi:hypothetical protein|nr:hypothetical protein [Bacteroidota bacterium]MBK7566520.1 hypothetical protein [Bacteroidota bacterium]MBP8915838.1 hypothetical protein [Chitinophagales bacterium]MBP9220814.1 hypothetical protein [Chitinophagales bacterium]MBP9794577.1 hypothetical protein [Chitinophagales bacterium]
MKESFKDGKRIIENNFEDWWNGLFDKIISGEYTDKVTGLITIYKINDKEINKIKSKKREIYWEAVDNKFLTLKNSFLNKYEKSEIKNKLLEIEISNYDKLIDETKLKLDYTHNLTLKESIEISNKNPGWRFNPIMGLNYSQEKIFNIRELYYKTIICGERNYSNIQSPNLQLNNRGNYFLVIEIEAIFKYINWLAEFKLQTEPFSSNEPESFITIEDLFRDLKKLETAINALKIVEPPIIDKDDNYLLGRNDKGAFTAWVKVLNEKGYIKTTNGEKVAPLLNKRFKGLKLGKDGRTLSNYETRSYKTYYQDFKALISSK